MDIIKYIETTEDKITRIIERYYFYRIRLSSFSQNLSNLSSGDLSGQVEIYRKYLRDLSSLEIEADRLGWKLSYIDSDVESLKKEYFDILYRAEEKASSLKYNK